MKTMHLFAGAGGGLLADLILGHDPVAAVEWDPYCCAVLRERAAEGWFPNLQVYEGDVRLFNASDWKGRVDLIHAGFPCQDISVAGKRAGVDEGTRSGLYREVLRCADEIRPKFLFLENVSAILSNGLGAVLGDLASRGYDGRWCCIRASDVGAPHQRDRWWCLAYANGFGLEKNSFETKIFNETNNTLYDGHHFSIHGKGLSEYDKIYSMVPEPSFVGVDARIPYSVDRIKACGNSQVPLQAALAFKIMMGRMK